MIYIMYNKIKGDQYENYILNYITNETNEFEQAWLTKNIPNRDTCGTKNWSRRRVNIKTRPYVYTCR